MRSPCAASQAPTALRCSQPLKPTHSVAPSRPSSTASTSLWSLRSRNPNARSVRRRSLFRSKDRPMTVLIAYPSGQLSGRWLSATSTCISAVAVERTWSPGT